MKIIYRLADSRLWDTETASWTDENAVQAEDAQVIDLISAEGVSNESYLIKTLLSYNYPLGVLLMDSPEGIRKELARLDAEYLTPRVLGGLAHADPVSIAMWNEHEKKAAPLRERLAELGEGGMDTSLERKEDEDALESA